MGFTDEEKRAWHLAKRKREAPAGVVWRAAPAAECLHCRAAEGMAKAHLQ